MNILTIIPARGGSKGIPRKNIRMMAGKPLIAYVIQNALKSRYNLDVVVSTDDEEINRISAMFGAKIIERPRELARDDVILDPVVYHATTVMERKRKTKYDVVITMQPTSPLLKVETLDRAIEFFIKEKYDTVISGVNHPHLSWMIEDGMCVPRYKKRLNRQFLPKNLLETGAFLISKREFIKENTRFGPNVWVFEIPEEEAIDIDSPQDWWIAEKLLLRKKILIRTDGYSQIGLGHIYRCLSLAYNLIDHQVRFVLSKKSDVGIEKIKLSCFPYDVIDEDMDIIKLLATYNCDIVINDILDTEEEYVKNLKQLGVRVVNFEDLGPGSEFADAVINDLYEKQKEGNHYFWGNDYYCLRDEFLLAKPKEFSPVVKEILVLFGGTDPCDLTQRLLDVVVSLPQKLNIKYTFVLGMGYKRADELVEKAKRSSNNIEIVRDVKCISEYMRKADIAVSSQGRTMFELASLGVPTILLAQNMRELHHEFGYLKNGFVNLGLGEEVDNQTIRETLIWLINCPQIRHQMRKQMLSVDLRNGLRRVIKIILGEEF